jgi:HPt (histidine-containing phosphotransfer) domain-containing protein
MSEVNPAFQFIDMAYLEEMSGGKKELIVEMIGIFKKQVPEFIDTMRRYVKEGNWKALGKISHKAKASAAIMGMNQLAADLKAFELMTNIRENRLLYEQYISDFDNRFQGAIKELDIYLFNN